VTTSSAVRKRKPPMGVVWKGRTDVSEPVYGSARGPRHHYCFGFGVSQAARSARFQMDNGVLRWKLGWRLVLMVFFHCLWVWKGRTDVSEQVYILVQLII